MTEAPHDRLDGSDRPGVSDHRDGLNGLTGLDDIAWSSLEHAYGDAADVPAHLRALYRPDEAVAAADDLLTKVYHQGGCVFSSAVAALPFVVRAAVDPAVTARQDLLELVGCLAHEGNRAEPRWVAPGWAEAWDLAVTALLPLLHDPAPEVRSGTAETLAAARERADEVLAALWTRWPLETVPVVRHRIVEAAGELAEHADREQAGTVRRLWELTEPGAYPGERLRAVEALRTVVPDGDDPRYARVVADVLDGGDLGGRSVAGAVALLGDDRAGRAALIAPLLGNADAAVRRGALEAAAGEMSRWRSAVPALLPSVAGLLDDPVPDNRLFAVRVLGMCGAAARPWVDRLACLVDDDGEPYPPVRDHALWALSRIGDPRCAEPLARHLAGERQGFSYFEVHSPSWWPHELGLRQTLAPLAAHADVLLPPLRARLKAVGSVDEARALCQVLTDWGPVAAPAVPELRRLLRTDAAVWAADALAAIGPEAAAAGDRARLRALIDAPPHGQSFAPRSLSLAYGRLTGDWEPALALFLPRLGEPYGNENPAIVLGELGPAGAPYVDRLRPLLREHATGWLPLRTGEALWRITGRADEVVPALVGAIEPFVRSDVTPAVVLAVRLLGEIGPAAAPAVPALRAFLYADERPVGHGTWRSVPEDDELCEAARTALRAIEGAAS
ncbi:hypothetical protein DEJ45_27800 [Streptomyces venezuelae]|uniref:HEAT repeat domain-containing protein n=1 Tax=Streptomyces venezuelae TaxID=54571 RepID=UPI00123D0E13|nr:HEAT repeat domain-containing protein [Streptomyces venezuelae]QES15801.1 hypothetical protein DEJ45_27800 [Streptomyces venezuelae]